MTAQRAFDPENANALVVTIIRAVAETEDKPATEITEPPLYDVIDIESLNSLLFSPDDESTGEPSVVEFTYRGHRIAIRGDAWVQVYSKTDE